ncbi:MAG TPA: type II toxin-antitoxin system VapC family toxin [bacterium]|nr:type II toxin-antitoxin system VapC family toxin [bacterium]HQO36791.1 type II toxin-antitoxin system VapC family toxin [bacterium]HQQ00244.1 type II toxin-antitoxin system VapC family toxin [bacterium]
MNLVDTSGWIEYFFAGPNATHFTPPIENTKELVVPVICLYEVFKKVNLVADEARALQSVAQMKHGRVVDLTEDIALSAVLISLKHKLPMADSLIYATARACDGTLWTQDEHFRGLPGVNYKQARTGATP